MRALLERRIGAPGEESGLTIVEVLVASIVLVLGAGATFGILGAATKNAQRAKATQVALELAQEEVERLRGQPYEELAVIEPPASSESALNPGFRVSGSQFALSRSPVGDYGTLVVDPDRGFSPESEFVSGNPEGGSGLTGTVYRYVVWRDDPACPESECPGEEDYKQIVVAVKPDKPGSQAGERGYVEVQSGLIDPTVFSEEGEGPEGGEGGEGEPDPGEDITAQQFFLSDTPCAASGTTTRLDIVGDHPLHNTLGVCADGLKTGPAEPGAPDALLLNGAPDPDPADPLNPPLYDYDSFLEPTPDTDKGVQIRRDDTSGCFYTPTGVTNPESQVHRWVTDPMPFEFEMTEKATLEFYTRTLNDALYTGTLCVFLFEREEGEETEDTLLAQVGGPSYWTYSPEGAGFWPRNSWAKVRLTMKFTNDEPHLIDEDNRLGVALSADPATTQAEAIPVMYDHPNYPTRIEVDTETPLEGEAEEEGG